MKQIIFAEELSFPFDVITQKIALMGGNGSGKSYAATLIEEQILKAGGWTIIFDPVGIHYGLRMRSDGKTPSGLSIYIFGGNHADVPLSPDSGALVADIVFEKRLSVILDVSHMTDAEINRFSTAFGQRFYENIKGKPQAVLIVLEECQEFIPQNVMRGEEMKLHVWTRIAKIGRNFGIGLMLISQRPQDVNKKVLNLTQFMAAFQMTGTHERKAMNEWFDYVGFEQKMSMVLPKLQVGQPFVASPRWLQFNGVVHVVKKKTYDASATPDFDSSPRTVAFDTLDISWLQERMQAAVDGHKKNNAPDLRKPTDYLKKPAPEVQIVREYISQIGPENRKLILTLSRKMQELQAQYVEANEVMTQLLAIIQKEVAQNTKPTKIVKSVEVMTSNLPVGENKVMMAILQFMNHGIKIRHIVLYTGYKEMTCLKYIGNLLKKEMIEKRQGIYVPTDKGLEVFKNAYTPLPTGDALIAYWLNILPQGESQILSTLREYYPNPIDKSSLAESLGYTISTVTKYAANLETRFLIVKDGTGYLLNKTIFNGV